MNTCLLSYIAWTEYDWCASRMHAREVEVLGQVNLLKNVKHSDGCQLYTASGYQHVATDFVSWLVRSGLLATVMS